MRCLFFAFAHWCEYTYLNICVYVYIGFPCQALDALLPYYRYHKMYKSAKPEQLPSVVKRSFCKGGLSKTCGFGAEVEEAARLASLDHLKALLKLGGMTLEEEMARRDELQAIKNRTVAQDREHAARTYNIRIKEKILAAHKLGSLRKY